MSFDAPDRMRLLFTPVALVTAGTALAFGTGLARDGFDVLDGALSACFVVIFGWIAFWCWISVIGAFCVHRARRELAGELSVPPAPCETSEPTRTAVLVPVHNEDPDAVFGRLRAMVESVSATGHAAAFDFFVLSDASDPDIWLREELCFAGMRRARRRPPSVYYRRRANNFRKKSGNIADFCERWGGRYRYLIILDADSIMDGRTMLELVRRMEHAPRLGILQAPSFPTGRCSLYARLQQFAASVYGPPLFAGLSYFMQNHASFWGHNAIVRTRAFIDHCGLPGLSGRPPFGGPILSHDFVEAAYMQRAGYDVRLAWDLLVGSYEECPVSLAAAATRDRRWCQGNLQHLRLVFSPTFSWKSRIQFAVGVLFYLTSALWGAFVVLSAAACVESTGSPATAAFGARNGFLVVAPFVCLFGAKLFALALAYGSPARRAAHGGARGLLSSAALEMLVATLTAPILMASHVVCLVSVVAGISVGWGPSDRVETSSPWHDALRSHGWQSALGGIVSVLVLAAGPGIALWTAPIWLGLIAAVPLAAVLSSPRWGSRLYAQGLLLTPSETEPPRVLQRAREIGLGRSRGSRTFASRFRQIVRDPWLNALHVALLEATTARRRPMHVVESLVCRIREHGVEALSANEAVVVLSDPWAMRTLHDESVVASSSAA
jgi:membrane glycosyltransferase